MFMQIRRPFQSSRTHHPSWSETEHDAISPCSSEKHISETFSTTAGPVQQQQQQQKHHTYTDTIRASSPTDSSHDSSGSNTSSRRPSASAEADDVRELWAVMLGLQQRYRCYNSTRMQIAADSESAVEMMPSRACIDLLNESIEDLPEEGWQLLERYLGENSPRAGKENKWRFWKAT